MQVNTPPTLFKYRGGKSEQDIERIFDILQGRLYFSTIKQFNDGFEFFYTFSREDWVNNNQNQRVILSPEQRVERFSPTIESMRNDAGYYCLCETESSLSMWALYANGHNGVCIGFDWDILKTAGPWNFGEKIEYRSIPVDLDQYGGGERWHKVFTSKHIDFSFESEWRLRLDNPGFTTEEKLANIKESISQIIFGFNADKTLIEKVIQKCIEEKINAEFFIMQRLAGQYALQKTRFQIESISDELETTQ